MKLTADNLLIKEINKTVVLDTIKKHSPISRADVNRLCGLNKGTVSNIVNDLIDDHFVYETGPGISSGGRKPVMLMFNNFAGYAIGINIEIKKVTGVLTDLNGIVFDRICYRLDQTDFEYIYEKLKSLIGALMSQAPECQYGVVGIGIGFPGSIDSQGTILVAPTLKWENVPLQKIVHEEFEVPVIVSNEARVGAQGETAYGYGQECNNLLYFSINYGIGSSLMIDKQFYKGHRGYAGDVGHMTFDVNGEECGCGNFGCWQNYASVKALLKDAINLTAIEDHLGNTATMIHLLKLAEQGDEETIQLFSKIGENIGIGISNIVRVINPELIVIGGKMTECKKWIHTSLVKTIEKRAKLFYNNGFQLEYSEQGDDATVLGAASIGISQLFRTTRITIN